MRLSFLFFLPALVVLAETPRAFASLVLEGEEGLDRKPAIVGEIILEPINESVTEADPASSEQQSASID